MKDDAPDLVHIYLDAPELGGMAQVGALRRRRARGTSVLSFEYADAWLKGDKPFLLDPRLDLYGGEQFPAAGHSVFGIFLDSAPDRWGRLLMDRREVLTARDDARKVQALGDWDYLLGLADECRMGALRFRRNAKSPWLADEALPAPPVTSLPELEAVSLALEQDHAEDLPAYRQWLSQLIAPGTSLGGARPKANYRESDGSLWIAKFPSREDRRDVGGWEFLLYQLAADCGVETASFERRSFRANFHTFCVQRFDRTPKGRRCFVSAMTLLERRDGEGGSYLDLAEYIQNHGARDSIPGDLEQLFRRVVFNVLAGNTDDHLRNHGFLRTPTGWRLAPAFDLNPNPARRHHTLSLDEASDLPDLNVVLNTAGHYRIARPAAAKLIQDLRANVAAWRERAKGLGLSSSEIDSVSPAFEAGT